MARGLRSTIKKANKARLRSKIFGPVEKARKERLSAKLLEQSRKESSYTEEDMMVLDQPAEIIGALDRSDKPARNSETKSDQNTIILECEKPSKTVNMRSQPWVSKTRKVRRGKPCAAMVFFNSQRGKGSRPSKR